MPTRSTPILIAADIGNSRIKLGRFDSTNAVTGVLPTASTSCELELSDRSGRFDVRRFEDWYTHATTDIRDRSKPAGVTWLVASVHRGAADLLESEIKQTNADSQSLWQIHRLSYRDVPMPICVDSPERVGIDRLLAAFAANRLRQPTRPAIVIDLGTATTVDLVSPNGEFCGGAILPGIAMSARALSEQTDALPLVSFGARGAEPPPVGKSTSAAIESGLYWGTIGAIREFIRQYSAGGSLPADVFLTGGTAERFAPRLASAGTPGSHDMAGAANVQYVEALVLSGIALVQSAMARP
jgi:type III pantothenate kinase